MGLEQIVNIQISRETTAVSQAGFGVAMVLAEHTQFSERIRFYTSLSAVALDFGASTSVYKAASLLFSQELRPTKIAVGRRTSDTKQKNRVMIDTVTPSTTYTVTINSINVTFDSDADPTAQEISAGLTAAINAHPTLSALVTATDNVGSLDIESDIFGEPFTITVDSKMSVSLLVANENIKDSLDAISTENDDWYVLISDSRNVNDIQRAAEWIETKKKLYIACNEDADVITTSTTDIASKLKSSSFYRTGFLWSGDQEKIAEAAWVGLMLPYNPDAPNGHPTWAFKTLSGVSADNLTDTQVVNLENKNANYYKTYAGVSITLPAKVAGGEYIDVMRGIDWLQSRLQERIFGRLVNLPKVPYTDVGLAVIESEIRAVLTAAVNVGFLAANPQFSVSMPLVLDISSQDRAQRKVTGITFTARIAGAVHAVEIQGTVTI